VTDSARARSVSAARARLASLHGREAEAAAADKLRANGFRVLWQNLRIGALELDLVARKGDLVVVVEVRTRGPGSYERPLASISRTKRRTLLRGVRALWKGRISKMPDVKRLRIDVAAVTRDADGALAIEWIAGAFTEDDA
jgi:putative endonuclease